MNRIAGLMLLCLGAVKPACAQEWSAMPELEARTRITQSATEAYRAGRYDELDARLQQYAHDSTRTSSGLWVSGMYEEGVVAAALSPRPQTDEGWDALERRTLEWARQRPASALARIVHAQVIMSRAWQIRGGGYANTVPPSAWKPFHAGLRRAKAYLVREKAVASGLPEYYYARADIARALDEPRSEIDTLLEDCDRSFAGYYPLYFAVLEYLLPKWHGDAWQVEQFARAAVLRTQASEGDSMYARIYWVAAQSQYENNLFFASDAQWELMKSGFEDVVKRYPDQWNYQNYAHFACQAGDTRTLHGLLSHHVESPILDAAWSGAASYEACGRLDGRVDL